MSLGSIVRKRRKELGLTQETVAAQVGISKPNPKLYQAALDDLQLEPAEAMYVGDNPLHDIAPPLSLGMVAVWSARAAKQTLEETGIEPTHTVQDFSELRTLLRDEYGVPV